MIKLITQNLVIAVIVMVAVVIFLSNDNTSVLLQNLETNQQLLSIKQQKLNDFKQQEKVSDIDLVANIDKFKQFLQAHYVALKLSKVKLTSRGMEYLLSGKGVDVLVLAHKALKHNSRIDFTKISFNKNNQTIIQLVVLGVEK